MTIVFSAWDVSSAWRVSCACLVHGYAQVITCTWSCKVMHRSCTVLGVLVLTAAEPPQEKLGGGLAEATAITPIIQTCKRKISSALTLKNISSSLGSPPRRTIVRSVKETKPARQYPRKTITNNTVPVITTSELNNYLILKVE